jgi:peptidoglycan/LPS O-acetylase OafA/YrhL
VNAPKARLEGLTGLRAVAALQVVFYHFGTHAFSGAPSLMRGLQQTGHAAVSLFFVLSGFVLVYTYSVPLGDGTVSRRRFWRARFARVYPLYALVVLVEIGLLAHSRAPTAQIAGATVGDLFGLQAWIPAITNVGNVPGWSVSVELFFYLLFPFLAFRPRRPLLAAGLFWLLTLAMAALPSLLEGDAATFAKCSPMTRLPEFLVGVALGHAFVRRPRPSAATGLALAAVAGVLATSLSWSLVPRYFIHALLLPSYALLIFAVASGGAVAAALSRPTMRALGDASYALYLLQMPLFQLVGNDYYWRWPKLCAFVALLCAVSYAAHRLIERPAQRAIASARA